MGGRVTGDGTGSESDGLSDTNAPIDTTIEGGNQNDGMVTGIAGGGGGDDPAGGVTETMDGCGTSVMAEPTSQPKVDVVWVVDASGSMLDEQIKIGNNITQFADDITSSSVDVRIVMMTTSAAIPVICPVVDPDPAAGTALAGDPRYMFINSVVDSSNALTIATTNYSQYESFLRPDAATHFVIVSDDESNYGLAGTPDQRSAMFQTDMQALLGKDFTLHTISSEGPAPCRDAMCMPDANTGLCVFVMLGCGAANVGATYWQLATDTGGLTASICQQDWSAIFEPLKVAIVESAPLPCNYPIPDPPLGQVFVRSKVNVAFMAPEASDEEVFGGTASAEQCADNRGWYFDSDSGKPNEVLLCPAACDAVAEGGTINVTFGCDTVVLE